MHARTAFSGVRRLQRCAADASLPERRLVWRPGSQVGGEAVSLMVPCCDMANHSARPSAEYRYDRAQDCFQIIASQVVDCSPKTISKVKKLMREVG